jgi:hypothetical protein
VRAAGGGCDEDGAGDDDGGGGGFVLGGDFPGDEGLLETGGAEGGDIIVGWSLGVLVMIKIGVKVILTGSLQL